jgi:hypothetical protein
MKTMQVLIYKKSYYLSRLIFAFCLLNSSSINALISFNKLHEYGRWFFISYQLYTKTNKLVIFKKKYNSDFTSCDYLNKDTFLYVQFKVTVQKTLFYKRLKSLQRTWKSWNVTPTYEWAWEYGIILFNLYKTVFEKELSVTTRNKKTFFKQFSIETFWLYINSVNNQILSLPLEAILQTIDLLAEAIPIFFDNNETNPKEINSAWIKKYGWAIIITGIPLWLKIMIIFKNYYQNEKLDQMNALIGMNNLTIARDISNMPSHLLPTINLQVDNKPDSVPHIQR